MARMEIDLQPVTHILTDAIGPPGQRIFYLQAWKEDRTVTLIVEKFQLQTLAIGLERFLEEIGEKYPDLPEASGDYVEEKMHINPPIEPMFRVGEIGLGYDADSDLVVLAAREMLGEDQDPEEASLVRFWCTRSQILSLTRWGVEMASRGRPICPQCGEPMEPEGHFCPKKNGHVH
jgi:uncharacterized repeat protein (TIGR03847 family)